MHQNNFNVDFGKGDSIGGILISKHLRTFKKWTKLYVSREYYSLLQQSATVQATLADKYGSVEVEISNLLPFELTYDAREVSTKSEIKISTGEMIHCVEQLDATPDHPWKLNSGEPKITYALNFQLNQK